MQIKALDEAEVDTGTGERSRPAVTEREVMVEEEVTWTRQDAAERRANIRPRPAAGCS